MRTITISDEDYKKVQDVLAKVEPVKEKKKGVTIYKIDGSILFESEKDTIREAVVEKRKAWGANLSKADLSEANLSKADLSGADLWWADLRGANLSEANLRGANLSKADLSEANLRRADLWGADLSEANLRRADLWGANLSKADLRRADLWGAELHNAKFYGRGGTQKLKRSQVDTFLKALGFIVEE